MILVTWSTGNVGSQLIPTLRGASREVWAPVHDESKAQPLREAGAELVVGDMERPAALGKAVEGVDHIYLINANGPTGAAQARNLIEAVLHAEPHDGGTDRGIGQHDVHAIQGRPAGGDRYKGHGGCGVQRPHLRGHQNSHPRRYYR